jgi:hypothetical protein
MKNRTKLLKIRREVIDGELVRVYIISPRKADGIDRHQNPHTTACFEEG